MFKLKFSTRLIFGIVLLELIVFSLLTWNNNRLIQKSQRNFTEQSIKNKTVLLSQMLLLVSNQSEKDWRQELESHLNVMEHGLNLVYIVLYNDEEDIIAQSGLVVEDKKTTDKPDYDNLLNLDRLDVEEFIYEQGRYLGFIRMGYDLSNIKKDTNNLIQQNTLLSLVTSLLTVLLTLLAGLFLVRRLRHLEVGALALQHDVFNYRIPVHDNSSDELSNLAKIFNQLAVSLEEGRDKLETEKQNSLQESRRLTTVLKTINAFVWEADPSNGQLTHISDDIVAYFGYEQSTWLEANFLAHYVHLEDYAPLYKLLTTQYCIDKQPTVLDFRFMNKQGRYHWLRNTSTVEHNEQGKVIRILGMFWDVTADKQAAEQLRESAAVFENTAEAVIITDKQQKITAVNPAFTKITGYHADEAIGSTPRILYQQRKERYFYTQMWYLAEARNNWQGEVYNQKKNGDLFPAWQNINAIKDDEGKIVNYIFSFSDIGSLKATEQHLEHLEGHDPLTDLPNRILFNQHLENILPYAHHNNQEIAILLIDLDRFKNINDSLGHHAGDRVIKTVAKRFGRCLKQRSYLSRIGGDEFTCLIEGDDMHAQASITAQALIDVLNNSISITQQDIFVTASIGISVYPHDGTTVQTLMQNADIAMYRAKEHGRNQYSIYTSQLTTDVVRRLSMETELRRALERDEFTVYYQPKVNLKTGHLSGAEALIRWIHPKDGMVSPAHFITLAEEVGLISAMDEWVLYKACHQTQQWLESGIKDFCIAVNLSHKQANRRNITEIIQDALDTSGLPSHALELEITEGFIMHNAEAAIANFKAFKRIGAQLAIDDFGTGYSSLSYLKSLPIDTLKIDQSFVRDIDTNKDDRAIVQTIINLAQNLNLKVIAEGVENPAQLRYLMQHNCDTIQGYYFSRPVPADEFKKLFEIDFYERIKSAQSE